MATMNGLGVASREGAND